MTISYTLKVANSRFGGFSKLLFRWKGSIYKLLYREFIVSVVLYTMLSIIYRQLLTEEQKRLYTKVAQYCNHFTDLIPMSFVLELKMVKLRLQAVCLPYTRTFLQIMKASVIYKQREACNVHTRLA